MKKAGNPFIIAIALMFGVVFAWLTLNLFGVVTNDKLVISILMIILGVGLFAEGNVRKFISDAKDGLTIPEMSHLFAIIIGAITFVVGVLALPGIGISVHWMNVIAGIATILAIPVTYIELNVY